MVSIRDYLSSQIGSTLRKENLKSCYDLTLPPIPSKYFKDFFDNYEFVVLDYANSLEKDLFWAAFYCSEKANYSELDLINNSHNYRPEAIEAIKIGKDCCEEKSRFFLSAMRLSIIERINTERRVNIGNDKIALNNDFRIVVAL